MANHRAGVLTMPGVHSTVWILAMSAELISHAVSNSRWSSQPGFSRLSTSQIALCSLVNSVCRHDRPNQKFSLKPLRSTPGWSGSSGRRPSGSMRSLPSVNERTAFWRSCVEPYSCEPSHQCVSVLPYSPWWAGSATVRRMCMWSSGQSSPSRSGTSMTSSGSPWPWKNQLWFSNWIHAAASEFSVVAGLNVSRVMSSSETSRGLGSMSRGSFSGLMRSGGMLRVNWVPAAPMSGWSRSFQRPPGVRAVRTSGGGSSPLRPLPNSPWRLRSRRSSRAARRFRACSPTSGSSCHWRPRFTRAKTECSTRRGIDVFPEATLGGGYPWLRTSKADAAVVGDDARGVGDQAAAAQRGEERLLVAEAHEAGRAGAHGGVQARAQELARLAVDLEAGARPAGVDVDLPPGLVAGHERRDEAAVGRQRGEDRPATRGSEDGAAGGERVGARAQGGGEDEPVAAPARVERAVEVCGDADLARAGAQHDDVV